MNFVLSGAVEHQKYPTLHHVSAAQHSDRHSRRGQFRSAAGRRWTQRIQSHSGAQLHHVPHHPQRRAPGRRRVQPHHPSVPTPCVHRKQFTSKYTKRRHSPPLCVSRRVPLLLLPRHPGGQHVVVHGDDAVVRGGPPCFILPLQRAGVRERGRREREGRRGWGKLDYY